MQDKPLVSVILATNRGGPFLREAIASVVNQTYPATELIVVDDGSADPGPIRRVLDDFPGVHLLRIEPSGVSVARNQGVRGGTGSFLAFIDDDDRWHTDRLQRHVAVMSREPAQPASYCRMRTIDVSGNELVPGDQRAAHGVGSIVRGETGVLLPNLMVRRAVFEQVGGFDPAYRQGEDLDLVLKLTTLGDFGFIDEVLVDYRHHALNTTRSHRDLATSIRKIVAAHHQQALAEGLATRADDLRERQRANDRFAAWSAARAARGSLRERRVADAISEIAWASRFAPRAPWGWLRRRMTKLTRQ